MTGEAVSSSAESRLATGLNYLLGQLKADARKTALLGGLVVVLIILLIRTAVQPDSASATVGNLLVPQTSNDVQTPSVCALADPPGSEDPVGFENAIEPKQTRITLPQRDIFALDLSYFSKLSSEQDQAANQANGISSEQAKLNALRQEVRQFRLQSTMTGAAPAACIDGTMVRKGQVYKGFKIERINNWNVLLEKDGHTFRLHIAQE